MRNSRWSTEALIQRRTAVLHVVDQKDVAINLRAQIATTSLMAINMKVIVNGFLERIRICCAGEETLEPHVNNNW